MAVLVIEDEPWLGELYTDLLMQAGYAVALCRDIYDAFDYLGEHGAEAIVLDLLLPWSNGIQLLHELASYEDLRTIPVILYSNALPKDLTLEQLRPYGVAAMLDKAAVAPGQLVATVQKVLHAKPAN
jgi:DNA-binding response OmpR family regulator